MTTLSETRLFKILVVGEDLAADEMMGFADIGAQIERAETLDAVLYTLRLCDFDAVVSGSESLSALCSSSPAQEAQSALASMPQGVCLVADNGALAWMNPRFLELAQSVREQTRRHCLDSILRAGESISSSAPPARRRHRLTTDAGGRYEITTTPIIDGQRRVTHVVAVVWDVTGAERWRERVDSIDRAGRDLLSLDGEQFSRLEPHERLSLLEQKILRCTRDLLQFEHFEIRLLDPQSNRLDFVLGSGTPCDAPGGELFACAEGNGICGFVAARRKSHICTDVTRDPRYRPGLEGARSSLTIPLFLHEQLVGVANFESATPAAFSDEDRQLAEIYGRYVALALHFLTLLVSERQATTGQIGRNVMAEITAPVNDILTDIESLVEDYIGHDDLRHRLRTISENAVKIRDTIKTLTQPRPGVIVERSGPQRRRDPILDTRRVLLVDDEDVIRETIRDVLTGYGCLVQTASDGATAIELLQSESFDLVLSDIKMPIKNGYEVFAAAKIANPKTPVILTTGFGYDPNHSIVRARREGLAAVLFKPFKVDQLLQEIRIALKPSPE